jgi:hypothetical protein
MDVDSGRGLTFREDERSPVRVVANWTVVVISKVKREEESEAERKEND